MFTLCESTYMCTCVHSHGSQPCECLYIRVYVWMLSSAYICVFLWLQRGSEAAHGGEFAGDCNQIQTILINRHHHANKHLHSHINTEKRSITFEQMQHKHVQTCKEKKKKEVTQESAVYTTCYSYKHTTVMLIRKHRRPTCIHLCACSMFMNLNNQQGQKKNQKWL